MQQSIGSGALTSIDIHEYSEEKKERQVALGNEPVSYLQQINEKADVYHEANLDLSEQRKTKHKTKVNDFEKKNYKLYLQKIKYGGPDYVYNSDLRPFLFFYKFMAKKMDMQEFSKHSNLKMWIPDTIVYNDDGAPFWLYCSEDGYVYKTENFNEKHIHTKIGNSSNPNEVIAVTKYADHDEDDRLGGHSTQVITTTDLIQSLDYYNGSNGRTGAVQRFVKCNGPNSFVCRTAWFKDKSSENWIITNKASFNEEFITKPHKKVNEGSIVYSRRGRHLEQTLPLIK